MTKTPFPLEFKKIEGGRRFTSVHRYNFVRTVTFFGLWYSIHDGEGLDS
jgi:hypothetical protein